MGEPTPTPELYPGHRAELERQQKRADAIATANRDPLPGPLLEAFAGVPQTVGGLTVRPLVHYDFVVLRKLNSPLLEHLGKSTSNKPQTPFTDEQGYEMVLLFTMPPREAAALIARGPEAFRQAALERIGFSLGPLQVLQLIAAVEREFQRAFSTHLDIAERDSGSANGTQVFPQPPAEQRTDSAGGSSTTSHSSAPSHSGAVITSSSNNPSPKAAPATTGPSCATPGALTTSPPTPTSPSTGNH